MKLRELVVLTACHGPEFQRLRTVDDQIPGRSLPDDCREPDARNRHSHSPRLVESHLALLDQRRHDLLQLCRGAARIRVVRQVSGSRPARKARISFISLAGLAIADAHQTMSYRSPVTSAKHDVEARVRRRASGINLPRAGAGPISSACRQVFGSSRNCISKLVDLARRRIEQRLQCAAPNFDVLRFRPERSHGTEEKRWQSASSNSVRIRQVDGPPEWNWLTIPAFSDERIRFERDEPIQIIAQRLRVVF